VWLLGLSHSQFPAQRWQRENVEGYVESIFGQNSVSYLTTFRQLGTVGEETSIFAGLVQANSVSYVEPLTASISALDTQYHLFSVHT
jgi:hypothetical protein